MELSAANVLGTSGAKHDDTGVPVMRTPHPELSSSSSSLCVSVQAVDGSSSDRSSSEFESSDEGPDAPMPDAPSSSALRETSEVCEMSLSHLRGDMCGARRKLARRDDRSLLDGCSSEPRARALIEKPLTASESTEALTLYNKLIAVPTTPSSPNEIWYAVDGNFVEALRQIIHSIEESQQCRDGTDSRGENAVATYHTQKHGSLPASSLPVIRNKPYVDMQFCSRQRMTKRIPLDPSKMSNLLFVDATTWTYIRHHVEVDVELPRGVIHAPNGGFLLEVQPIKLWLVTVENNSPLKQIQSTLRAEGLSREDTLDALYRLAFGEIGADPVDIFEAPCLCSGTPEKESDVGMWRRLELSLRERTLYEIGIDSPRVLYIVKPTPSAPLGDINWDHNSLEDSEEDDAELTPSYAPPDLGGSGLVGLANLGNTCFMNSALQCLSHTMPLTEYFLSGIYEKDVNVDNPLGMRGKLALTYASFLKEAWSRKPQPGSRPPVIVPKPLKVVIGQFAPQFLGFQQQDSHELTAFLLDGLHEDLNRIIKKPYVEAVDGDDIEDNEALAQESWKRHKSRNDSIVVDTFQGQYRSRLECPLCGRVSVVFDPFMYLSLPIPTTVDIPVTVTLVLPSRGHKTRGIAFDLLVAIDDTLTAIKLKIVEQLISVTKTVMKEATTVPVSKETDTHNKLQPVLDILQEFATETDRSFPNTLLKSQLAKHLVLLHCERCHLRIAKKSWRFLNSRSTLSFPHGSFTRPEREGLFAFIAPDALTVELAEYVPPPSAAAAAAAATTSAVGKYQRRSSSTEDLVFPASLPTAATRCLPQPSTLASRSVPEDTFSTSRVAPSSPMSTTRSSISSCSSEPEDSLLPAASSATGRPEALDDETQYSSLLLIVVCTSSPTEVYHASYMVTSGYFPVIHRVPRSTFTCKDLFQLIASEHFIVREGDGATALPETPSVAFWSPDLQKPIYVPPLDTVTLDAFSREKRPGGTLATRLALFVKYTDYPNNIDILSYPSGSETERLSQGGFRPVHISECLAEFLKEERLEADNMWYCNRCKQHVQARKRIDIWRVPEILLIHLKRFSQTRRYYRSKNNAKVLFDPQKPLDLSPFVRLAQRPEDNTNQRDVDAASNGPLLYDLFAMSNHYGSLAGGHYTATVKCRLREGDDEVFRWIYFDDSCIVPNIGVDCSRAYLLFFQRRHHKARVSD